MTSSINRHNWRRRLIIDVVVIIAIIGAMIGAFVTQYNVTEVLPPVECTMLVDYYDNANPAAWVCSDLLEFLPSLPPGATIR